MWLEFHNNGTPVLINVEDIDYVYQDCHGRACIFMISNDEYGWTCDETYSNIKSILKDLM